MSFVPETDTPNSYSEDNVIPLSAMYEFFNKLFLSNALGIALYSIPERTIIRANKKFLQLLDEQYSSTNKIKGKKPENFIMGWESSEECHQFQRAVDTATVVIGSENKIVLEKGLFYWETMFIPVVDDGKVKYIITNTEDKTDKVLEMNAVKKQNEDLEKVLKAEQEFLSFISHEFKTPLTISLSAIQAVESICRDEVSDRAFNYINKIRKSSFQQLRLVNNLLDIAKADSGYYKLKNINGDIVQMTKAIAESVKPYAKEKGVTIKFIPKITEKYISIDDEKFERVLLNLLSNAVKFTPSGKKIYVALWEESGRVKIEVKDEGIGIALEKQSSIFERFIQAENDLIKNTSGTGIGLYLVKTLASIMGGEITLKSEPGNGSAFCLSLPDVLVELDEELEEEYFDERLTKALNLEFSSIYFD